MRLLQVPAFSREHIHSNCIFHIFAYLYDDFQLLQLVVCGYDINEHERHHNAKYQILPYSKFHRQDLSQVVHFGNM
jgi:hypothetical protein